MNEKQVENVYSSIPPSSRPSWPWSVQVSHKASPRPSNVEQESKTINDLIAFIMKDLKINDYSEFYWIFRESKNWKELK